MGDKIRCTSCGEIVENAFSNPYDYAGNISPFHTPRSAKEYLFQCSECKNVIIFPQKPLI